jgi:PAS domain S-box-containing protein
MFAELVDVLRAVDRDELTACFQPIVELRSGRLTGFEVLARWQHPEFGLVLPENFISLAENNGLIGSLTKQVLYTAFQAAAALPESLTLAVNLSPVQLRYSTLSRQIQDVAEEFGFPLTRLTLEITESALLYDLDRAKVVARDLKNLGCSLALDDFGTGYSSLRHLQALPFDVLKIDRSFVAAMTNTRESRKIVAAMVGLARSLNMVAVAEGIELEKQVQMLLRLDCEQGQGWLYGRPVPAEDLTAMVAASPYQVLNPPEVSGATMAASSLEAQPMQRLAQLQAIYDGVPVGLCFLDKQLRYVSLNRRLADMNGASVESHLGRTILEKYPEWFPLFEPYLLRALQGEAISGVEILRPGAMPGDKDRTILVSYQPAWDEAEEVIGISLSLLDITEHIRLGETASENSSDSVEMSLPVPWSMDRNGLNLRLDVRWRNVPASEHKGMRKLAWLDALHPDDLQAATMTIKVALRTGAPIDMEYRVRDADQQWRWMRSRGSARIGTDGEITRWFGNVLDIHERRQMEEALLKSKAAIQ